jgi:hypothetical protein
MLIVDHRDRDLIKALDDAGVVNETRALDVGDLCFQDNGYGSVVGFPCIPCTACSCGGATTSAR